MADFESILKQGITPLKRTRIKSPEQPAKSKEFPLRDLSLAEVDFELVPDYCWRGNYSNPRLLVVTEAPTSYEMRKGKIAEAFRAFKKIYLEIVDEVIDHLKSEEPGHSIC